MERAADGNEKLGLGERAGTAATWTWTCNVDGDLSSMKPTIIRDKKAGTLPKPRLSTTGLKMWRRLAEVELTYEALYYLSVTRNQHKGLKRHIETKPQMRFYLFKGNLIHFLVKILMTKPQQHMQTEKAGNIRGTETREKPHMLFHVKDCNS